MKYRSGFVSNSSSSSFVVHKSSFTSKKWKELIRMLKEMVRDYEENDEGWSGMGYDFYVQGDFLAIGNRYIRDDDIDKLIDFMGKDVYKGAFDIEG